HALALVDEAEQDVLGPDVVVVEEPCFLLGQDDDPSGTVGEAFEQETASLDGGALTGSLPGRVYLGTGCLAGGFPGRPRRNRASRRAWPIVPSVVGLASLLDLPALTGDLARVEDALRLAVEAPDPFLTEVASHLISAGGKRLRPALALAAGYAAAPDAAGRAAPSDCVMGAVSVELVHLGSLYHDDVMDEALTRRGVESVNARWGNLVAILAGDFLLARASEIAATLGTEVAGLLAATIGALCEGQVRELTQIFDVARSEEAYLEAIQGKTAALMSASCRIGALTAGLPRPTVDALTTYGQRLGMVFQVVDDVPDVACTDEQLGKPP